MLSTDFAQCCFPCKALARELLRLPPTTPARRFRAPARPSFRGTPAWPASRSETCSPAPALSEPGAGEFNANSACSSCGRSPSPTRPRPAPRQHPSRSGSSGPVELALDRHAARAPAPARAAPASLAPAARSSTEPAPRLEPLPHACARRSPSPPSCHGPPPEAGSWSGSPGVFQLDLAWRRR